MEPSSTSDSQSLEHILSFLSPGVGVATKNSTKTEAPTFPELPAEIRCLIWHFCLPGSRLVPIQYELCLKRYSSRISTPVVLRINRESRCEGLKVYLQVRLGTNENIGCYVDPLRDTVYLTGNPKPPSKMYEFVEHLHEDLYTSPDFEALFKNLTVGIYTWRYLFHRVCDRRLKRHLDLRLVRPVYEKGSGPVYESMEVQDFRPFTPGQHDSWSWVGWKDSPIPTWLPPDIVGYSYKYLDHHEHLWHYIMDDENGRDLLQGRPAMLQFAIIQCYIETGGKCGSIY